MVKFKNIVKAANRIKKAIRNNERIILYGDADLDGVASVIILKESIQNLYGPISTTNDFNKKGLVEVYFPDRETEGYGISETSLNYLKKFSPGLFISLDCGISNFKEVKLAKKLGFEVIIIDHHQVLDKLPEAEIIVDPKQERDKYPFKELANTGIVFKLAEVLFGDKMTESLRKNFLELTALATIADMMPREKENEKFIGEGLSSLENSWRPGIQALLECQEPSLNLDQKVSKIISILNVRDMEDNLPASFRLLTSSSLKESKELAKKLIERHKLAKAKTNEIVAEAEKRIAKKESPIIFEGDFDWDFTLISSIASILCNKYQKPTFIFKILGEESQGTVRVPKTVDSVALMKKCKRLLLSYGGHAQASGFRIRTENLDKFKQCLVKNYNVV